MGASWGHHQFTAGDLTCTRVLDSWDNVGGPMHVVRLIAAALKTCRAARLLCQDLVPQPPFLADVYLQNVVERLWVLMQTVNKVFYQFHIIFNFGLGVHFFSTEQRSPWVEWGCSECRFRT
jgi:hypothetical protein